MCSTPTRRMRSEWGRDTRDRDGKIIVKGKNKWEKELEKEWGKELEWKREVERGIEKEN